MLIRKAEQRDLPRLLEIYNREVVNGTATFDLEPLTLAERQKWFDAHNRDNHPLLVAEVEGVAVGYASLSRFHEKAAYGTTVELSVYVEPAHCGRGIGQTLARAVIDSARADPRTHRVVSLVTASNTASRRLHEKLGFRHVGTITEAGMKFGRFLDVDYWELAV
ncbi:MAG TPA: GNAT family N-acetyltransferase [Sutterella sp.]|nr:GNAT family N-acetyltransferase [Sutterella sp.]